MKRFLSLAKYPIALAILLFVLKQADGERIIEHMQQTPVWALLLALLSFTLAQISAISRMNAYYAHAGRPIAFGYAFRLHYVGLFYNIILPGGIGGDGYKVYALKRHADYPVKDGIRIQLLTRTNGLLVLLISLAMTLPFLNLPFNGLIIFALSLAMAACAIIGYFIIMPYLLKAERRMEWQALPYSCALQFCNVGCMAALWAGLSDGQYLAETVFLFQLAAIAGMLPVTIGGLGLREFTFFYGTNWLNDVTGAQLNPELGVVISLLVFAVTATSAIIGLVWIGRVGAMKSCDGTD